MCVCVYLHVCTYTCVRTTQNSGWKLSHINPQVLAESELEGKDTRKIKLFGEREKKKE